MIISPSRNFIFIHLEKCGGTSVESALEPFLRWDDLILGSTEFGEKLQALYNDKYGRSDDILWKHSTANEIYQFVTPDGWNEFKKIAIVRNPVDIVISLYYFSQTIIKYHVGRINYAMWKENLRTGNIPKGFPFTEDYVIQYIESSIDGSGINGFVQGMLKNKSNAIRTQFDRLQINGKIDIDLIIDLSELNKRWKEVVTLLDIQEDVSLNNLNASEKANIDISEKSLKAIKKHFALDYDVFPGYTGITW